jgi:signal transduction histidine kinase
VRHDLRHAASTIQLLVATVRDAPPDPATDTALDAIAQSARGIADLVRSSDDESPADPIEVDQLADRASRRAGLLYEGTLTWHCERACVVAQELDITRLLTNLITNACRAAGPTGRVHVTVSNEDGWVVVGVADSGAGFRDAAPTVGVGLSVVAAMTVRLEGSLAFGRSPLGGAQVTVHLPQFEPVIGIAGGQVSEPDEVGA